MTAYLLAAIAVALVWVAAFLLLRPYRESRTEAKDAREAAERERHEAAWMQFWAAMHAATKKGDR